jgi:dTDP-glucose pyrophosphorylase
MIAIHDLGLVACQPGITIREAMARINANPHVFLIVVDAGGRVIGTVTDGDVRRGLLRGVGLDRPVTECMQREPTTGRFGGEHEDAANARKLATLQSRVAFLPIVDEEGILRHVLVLPTAPPPQAVALVMAGGSGKRLGEETRKIPKPLLEVGEKPLLERALESLEEAAVNDIYVSVYYLADEIERYVAARRSRSTIHILREEAPLGTAGAIGLLPAGAEKPLIVLNGDVLTRVDLSTLLAFHERHGLDGTIAAAQHEVQIPYGVVHHSDDGQFLSVEEKPRVLHFVAAGIYVLASEFRALVRPNVPMDMPELLNVARGAGLRLGLFPIHEYWTDVGQPGDLSAARQRFGAHDAEGR